MGSHPTNMAAQAMTSSAHGKTAGIMFMSMGGAVLDEIWIGREKVASDSLGGAGVHATIGARLFLASRPQSLAWKLKAGEDFPRKVEDELQGWKILLDVSRIAGTLSSRNQLTHHDEFMGQKTFRYLVPATSLAPPDLKGSKLLHAEAYHFHVPPVILDQQVSDLLHMRADEGLDLPLILWEPTRPTCNKENLQTCTDLVKFVDVFSPNHDELAALHGITQSTFDHRMTEQLAQYFVDAGVGHDGLGIVVIRAGEHGCLVLGRGLGPIWLPPFYEKEGAFINAKVVDTTGAGNAFLGGFAIGLLESGNPVVAAHYGTVASSFMVEQIGLPKVRYDEEGGETWNGEVVRERLAVYQDGCGWFQYDGPVKGH
jgi:sugar/nucleoside kinase (ribokinase family)